MEKLIITVTCDSRMSYPANENCPQVTDTKGVAAEYNRSVDAGAVIAHMHGSYSSDPEIMPDGRKLQIPMLGCVFLRAMRAPSKKPRISSTRCSR